MKKSYALFIVLFYIFVEAASGQSANYVTPNGSPSNDGSGFNSPMDLFTDLDVAQAGDEIILYGATYSISYVPGKKNTIIFSKSGSSGNYITLRAVDNSIATVGFSFPNRVWVQDSYGFYVTGDYSINSTRTLFCEASGGLYPDAFFMLFYRNDLTIEQKICNKKYGICIAFL
jgi:hypothetical protein